MKRMAIMVFAALLGSALVFSAAATAKPGTDKEARKLAKQQCKAEKRADKQAFKATYGKRAMRTCTKGEKSEVKDELRNAAKQCKAEREADRDAFKETYGSNSNKKNALGKCVSSKVKAEIADEVGSFKNAAKECKSERETDGEAFREKYGSNSNKKNALGKCVSSKVKAEMEAAEG